MSWVRWGAPLTDNVDYCKEHGLTSDLYIYLKENEVVVCFAKCKPLPGRSANGLGINVKVKPASSAM